VTITGTNFGATQGASTVKFNGTAATATSWSATSIVLAVPTGATTGNVVVTVGGLASNGVAFTIQADTTPPTVPTGLTALAISSSQINLSWTASTDNVGVTGYKVYRGGTQVGTSVAASYSDTGLTASTTYSYTVSAYDAAGNNSAQSTAASATTLAASSGGGLPTALGWYQIPNTTGPACPAGFSGCNNVVAAWGGGAADTVNNRLVVWGGGHTDYAGNEVYVLDLNALTFGRINNPSNPTVASGQCSAANPDGTAAARHTYDNLAFIPTEGGLNGTGALFAFGGSLAPTGCTASDTWMFDMATTTWINENPAKGTLPAQIAQYQAEGDVVAWDPNTQSVFVCDNTSMFQWIGAGTSNGVTPISNTYSKVGGCSESASGGSSTPWTGVIDPKRRKMFIFGYGQINSFDLTNLGGTQQLTIGAGTGCPTGFADPGVDYDPVLDEIVIWGGGNTVYLYNADTNTCTSQTYSGGPTCTSASCSGGVQANGTFGRFRYFPKLDVFAVVNDWASNAYALRLSSSTPNSIAEADFNARANASGVVLAQNFDTSSGFQQNVNIYASDEGVFPSQDSTTARAGSSLRIDIPPFQDANSGKFNTGFTPIGGSNVDFYFQVATRISPEMLSDFVNYDWPTWKNHGYYFGNTSCTGLMEVTGLSGSTQPGEPLIPEGTAGGCSDVALVTNGGNPPFYLQQSQAFAGWTGYQCLYRSVSTTPCFAWPSNTWITFYYHIRLGTFSATGTNWPGTLVEAWVATNGGPYRQWLYLPNFPFNGDGVGDFFESLELYPYMTGKDASQGGYPTAHVWFDELLVSSQPIPAPLVPPALP
jgi:hypothetical protein